MSLVAEADRGGDLNDRFSLEETLTRRFDSPTENIRMRGDAEGLPEAANEMCRARSEDVAGRRKCHDLELVAVEEFTQAFRELAHAAWITLVDPILEVHPEAFDHECEVGLSLECIVGMSESLVQNVQTTT